MAPASLRSLAAVALPEFPGRMTRKRLIHGTILQVAKIKLYRTINHIESWLPFPAPLSAYFLEHDNRHHNQKDVVVDSQVCDQSAKQNGALVSTSFIMLRRWRSLHNRSRRKAAKVAVVSSPLENPPSSWQPKLRRMAV